MALTMQTAAYGAVAVAALVLFGIGTPAHRAREAPVAAAPVLRAASPAQVASGNGVTLRSVSVTFPESDSLFPGGAVAEVLNSNCLACHSPDMVLNQPSLTKARWEAVLEHMRVDYKAPVGDAEIAMILGYLVATKGLK